MAKKVIAAHHLRGKITPYAFNSLIGLEVEPVPGLVLERGVEKIHRQTTHGPDGFRYRAKLLRPCAVEYYLQQMRLNNLPAGVIPVMLASLAATGGAPEEYVITKYNDGVIFTDTLEIGEFIWRVHFTHEQSKGKEGENPFSHLKIQATPRKIELSGDGERREMDKSKLPRKTISSVRFLSSEENCRKMAEVIAQIPLTNPKVVERRLSLEGWEYYPDGFTADRKGIEGSEASIVEYGAVLDRVVLALAYKEDLMVSPLVVAINKPEGGYTMFVPRFKRTEFVPRFKRTDRLGLDGGRES